MAPLAGARGGGPGQSPIPGTFTDPGKLEIEPIQRHRIGTIIVGHGSNELDSSYPTARSSPNDFCQPNRGMSGNVCLRLVGTRGGRGAGWGPCACPGGMTSGLGCVRPPGRIPTRTSTRPPHPPHAAPCPYRTQDAPSPIQLATFIRVTVQTVKDFSSH